MRILFVGGGNMAGALIGGLLQQGFSAGDFKVVDISAEARSRLSARCGVQAVADLDAVRGDFDVVLLAVKPQHMAGVCKMLAGRFKRTLVISIAAGIRTGDLERWLAGHQRLVRAMPNTPALLRAGVSGLYAAPGASAQDRHDAQRILGAVGSVVWFDSEAALDAVTAVSGSGPAYVFYFIESVEEAARSLGVDAAAARKLALDTFLGAARLAVEGEDPPAVLREKVTSKGGTTERALASLNAADVKAHIVAAVRAAAERARELGDEFGKV
ncbi:MAG: pyrroline-5-carboxylate reductase [Burkholderiales bacterium]